MPHIHNKPGQHDVTVSAYIVRIDQPQPLCLVHMHRKMGKLMQAGGHLELNETPWQSVAHEIAEETGYTLAELKVAQHTAQRTVEIASINHPVPFDMNTHSVGNDHFHSDLCYGFVAEGPAKQPVASGEAVDQRWLTVEEMAILVANGEAIEDMYHIYKKFVANLTTYVLIAATDFSLEHPTAALATYKFGAPGE